MKIRFTREELPPLTCDIRDGYAERIAVALMQDEDSGEFLGYTQLFYDHHTETVEGNTTVDISLADYSAPLGSMLYQELERQAAQHWKEQGYVQGQVVE